MALQAGNKRDAGCAICLEPITGESFLDQCFHSFCYHCILQWSEMILSKPQSTSNRLQCLKCPLCKTGYGSIIHDLSGSAFQRHYLLSSHGARIKKSDAHSQRRAAYASKAEWKLQSVKNTVPSPNRWVYLWVQRELQALMQEDDVETVTQHVVGIVEAFKKGTARGQASGTMTKGLDWHDTISSAVRPFIFELSEKFAEELRMFLVSGLDIAAYDHQNQYELLHIENRTLVTKADADFSSERVPYKFGDLYDEDVDDDSLERLVGRGRGSTDTESS